MKYSTVQVFVGLLLPLFTAAQNSTSSNTTITTNSTSSLLSSGTVALGDWADAYAKATALIDQLTNDEKITLITGGSVSSVNWTALEIKDSTEGPQGRLSTNQQLHTY
jgi:beta-glucosidase